MKNRELPQREFHIVEKTAWLVAILLVCAGLSLGWANYQDQVQRIANFDERADAR